MKPYSESCDQNRYPILAVLQQQLPGTHNLLEIGSGTGQHAVYFAADMPNIIWQPSDVAQYIPGIELWRIEASLPNVLPTMQLDVVTDSWPTQAYDVVYSANTCHIMSWPAVVSMFQGIGKILRHNGKFILYGSFNVDNHYTSPSNQRFDQWLRQRDPESAIRDLGALQQLAIANGMHCQQVIEMPANNKTVVWSKDE